MTQNVWQVGRLLKAWEPPKVRPLDRLVGIELEYENVTGITLHDPHPPAGSDKVMLTSRWCAFKDGSLRNHGGEFVSEPIPVSSVYASLIELYTSAAGSSKWRTSIRTGLHIHVDVRDLTAEQLRTVATAYCLLEPALFHYVGTDREENVFCVPWYRAPGDLQTILAWLDHKSFHSISRGFLDQLSKYDAVNWMPLTKFGTIEFRHAPCTKDMEQIAQWARICVKIIELAFAYDQRALLKLYLDNPDNFPRTVIGPILYTPDYEALMLRSNAEWLANQTIKAEKTFDPKDATAWVRINDRIEYKEKNPSAYLRRIRGKSIPVAPQLHAQAVQMVQASQQIQAASDPTAWPVLTFNEQS